MRGWSVVGGLVISVTAVMLGACGGGGEGDTKPVSTLDWDVLPVTASTQVVEGNNVTLSSRDALAAIATQPFLAALPTGTNATSFASSQADLVAADTNGFTDVFQSRSAVLRRLSIPDDASDPDNAANKQADGNSGVLSAFPGNNNLSRHTISVSEDGQYTAFVSEATNLVAADNNGVADVYVRYTGSYNNALGVWRDVPRTFRVSIAADGTEPTLPSFSPAMMAHGVAFVTASQLVATDTNGTYDVYLKNLDSGNVTLISRPGPGAVSNGASFDPQVAGQYIFFLSWATNLDGSDSNNALDLFRYDLSDGSLKRLPLTGNAQGDKGLLGVAYSGQISFPSRLFSVSSTGRYIAFLSESTNLVAGDNNARLDAFVLDAPRGRTVRVSVNASGSVSGATMNGIAIATHVGETRVINNELHTEIYPQVFFTSDEPYLPMQTGGNGIDVYARSFFKDKLSRISNTQTDSWPISNVDYLYGARAASAIFSGSATALGGGTITGLFSAEHSAM